MRKDLYLVQGFQSGKRTKPQVFNSVRSAKEYARA